jgi:hypothetical protein
MRLSEATTLVQQALTPVEDDLYTLDVVFNKEVVSVKIHKKHIPDIVQDILIGQGGYPRCTLYAQSVRRLMLEEKTFLKGKYSDLNRTLYNQLRWELLNLDVMPDNAKTPREQTLYSKFVSLGLNPTGAIDYDNKTKFHLNNLLRKNWRSRNDYEANKTVSMVLEEMHMALRENPKTAFTTNRYLPSVIEYYMEK